MNARACVCMSIAYIRAENPISNNIPLQLKSGNSGEINCHNCSTDLADFAYLIAISNVAQGQFQIH